VVRLEQVLSRLWRLARLGRARLAGRIAAANVPINSFFLFTIVMIVLYVVTGNGFLAQGRHWFPMLLPIFLTSVVYAPKALSLPPLRRALSAALLAGLALYCAVGSYYAWRTVQRRYYLGDGPLVATALALRPDQVHEMEWHDGLGLRRGQDSYVEYRLEKPSYVTGLQVRFELRRIASPTPSAKESAAAVTAVFWQEAGRTSFHDGRHGASLGWPPDGREKRVTMSIGDTIDQVRIHPDWLPEKFEVKIKEIVLLKGQPKGP
jgi:hypothetical protein